MPGTQVPGRTLTPQEMVICSITLLNSHTEWAKKTKNEISNAQHLLNGQDELLHYFYNTQFLCFHDKFNQNRPFQKKKKKRLTFYSTGCIWKNILYVNFKDVFYSKGAIQLHILQSRYLPSHWEGSLDLYGAIPHLLQQLGWTVQTTVTSPQSVM